MHGHTELTPFRDTSGNPDCSHIEHYLGLFALFTQLAPLSRWWSQWPIEMDFAIDLFHAVQLRGLTPGLNPFFFIHTPIDTHIE